MLTAIKKGNDPVIDIVWNWQFRQYASQVLDLDLTQDFDMAPKLTPI
jgi:hypothetical protein